MALGVWFALAFRLVVLAFNPGLIEFPGSVQLFLATRDTSAWFFGNTMLLIAIVVALAAWSFYTALGGRLWADASDRVRPTRSACNSGGFIGRECAHDAARSRVRHRQSSSCE